MLITGAGGQLGRELQRRLAASPHEVTALSHEQWDISQPGAADAVMSEVRPDAVLNCAAWTRVDAAESQVEAAYSVNATGPELLAQACARADALLVHLSTDYVFDGEAPDAVDERTPPHPLNVYGASKLAGEEAIRAATPKHQIVRTSWLFGQQGPNFVLAILSRARRGEPLRVVADQEGAPTWTGHLAPALIRLAERGDAGTFHLSNSGSTTWHGLAGAILEETGLDVPLAAVTTADFGAPARRPPRSILDNRAWRMLGEPPLPPWRHGLRDYLVELGVV